MPLFSIVVTAYGNDEYLPGCLNSLANQTFTDWECVVVNDASPDSTLEIAQRFSSSDARFKVVDLKENRGLHLARKAGAKACAGEYVIFLDADDEFTADGLDQLAKHVAAADADMVHFGINVIAAGVGDSDCEGFGAYINNELPDVTRAELVKRIFSRDGGYQQDWRVTQCAYTRSLVARAFDAMTDERLDRAEDCYEFLVLADMCKGQHVANEVRLLDYYYGRGVTGTSVIGEAAFCKFVDEFAACATAIKNYCGARLEEEFDGTLPKLMDLLFNDWNVRLASVDKPACARYAADRFGFGVAAEQVIRVARDAAYARLVGDEQFEPVSDESIDLFKLGEELASQANDLSAAYADYHRAAVVHLNDLERRAGLLQGATPTLVRKRSYESQDIRIFVTTHKDVDIFNSNILQPVQVGMKQPRERLLWAYQDDEGDNIAQLNAQFCELTTQYWAWKNVDARYYGFCHYRRYFDFAKKKHEENPWGEVIDGRINWSTQKKYRLDDASIAKAVEGYDIVTTGIKDLRKFPEEYASAYDHYERAPYLKVKHLDRVIEILKERYPDYAEDADAYLSGYKTCFCNMYIMRKEYFDRYCDWMFPMLFEFAEEWDTTYLSQEALRTPGHLSERLFNIWLTHEKRVNPNLKHKQVQCVHFEHPERYESPSLPAVDGAGKQVIPVVFAADNNYVPMVTTTVYSMLKNSSPDYFYDVVIFATAFTEANKEKMLEFFSQFDNASLRFADVAGMIEQYNLKTTNKHISVETYYRFLIQQVLPEYEKVLYLDSDLIVLDDVAQLFNVELGDNLLGAARDTDFLGNMNMNGTPRVKYADEVLKMKDPYGYFQAGVLVMNLAEMRALYPFTKWLELASEPKYIYDDQDILNAHCQGRVTYIDNAWNVMNDCAGRIKKVFSFAPAQVYKEYLAAYDDPKIVHYAGYEKPWKPGHCDMAALYWSYCRETPFYEVLITTLLNNTRTSCDYRSKTKVKTAMTAVKKLNKRVARIERAQKKDAAGKKPKHQRAISKNSKWRRVFDGVLPLGSRRREAAKAVVRFMRGRK